MSIKVFYSLKVFYLLALTSLWTTYATPANSDVISKIQVSWAKTKSYQAKFHQVITAKRMGSKDESTGEVSVLKPGKIRWDMTSEGKVQILNGKRLIHIQIPKRRKANVVDIYESIEDKIDTKSLSFLSGTEEFKTGYHIKIISENSRTALLKLVPKTSLGSDTYIAEFDKSSYLLRSLVTESADTKVRTDFLEIKTNLSLSEDLFEYKRSPTDIVTINK